MLEYEIRPGTPDDEGALLALFDEAVAWMVARGQTGQWGDRPFSEKPSNVERAEAWAAGGGLRIAELGGEPAGLVVLGGAHPGGPPAGGPGVYLRALRPPR